MPRGSFKSSCATVGYPLWLMVQPESSPYTLPSLVGKGGNKNMRILLDGEERNKVPREKISEMKGKIEAPKFKSLFGKLRPDVGWREDEFTIATRDKGIWGVPTVVIGGVDTELTGLHFDLIIADDLVGETNVNTEDQILKVIRHYQHYRALLVQGGRLIIIGTPWDARDLYHTIEADPNLRKQYEILKKPAHNPDGSLLFPQLLTEEFLQAAKVEMGSHYYPQYELAVSATQDVLIRKQDIQYFKLKGDEIWVLDEGFWKPRDLRVQDLTIDLTCDEAYTKEKYADYTGISVKGEDKDRNWYILESKRGRWVEHETIAEIQLAIQVWNAKFVGLESTRFKVLSAALERNGVFARELKPAGRSKFTRFKQTEPRFARRKVFIQKEHLNLEHEILSWTHTGFRGKHDDEVDAFAYHEDMGVMPRIKREPLYVGGYRSL